MKLHTISINNLMRRKARMAFVTAGLMVVMVTHNPENGTYADRTIHLKDGMVVNS